MTSTSPISTTDIPSEAIAEGAPIPLRPNLGRIMRSTALVMILSMTTKVISLGQTFLIARQFGVSADYDTFVTANRIPEQIFNLIAGGALAYAFIPIFGGLLAQEKREAAWKLASNILNSVFLVALIISGIVFLTAPQLIAGLAPNMRPELQIQTAELMRVLLLSLLLFSISGLSVGILQSHQHFLLPALAPVMFDIGLLIGIVFLARPFGVYGLAYGSVLGALMHLAVQIPGLIMYKMRWRPYINPRDPDFLTVIRLMIPRAIGLALFNLNMVVAVRFATDIGEGAVSAFDWGWRLMQFPETLIGTAMGIVIFPTLAALSAAGDREGKRDAMSGALRFVLFSAIPAAVLLIVAGRPALRLLEGGAMDTASADLIFGVLIWFAPGVIVHSMVEIVARSFYADRDTVTPLWAALLTAGVNLPLAWFFATQTSLGVAGLSLANTVAVGAELVFLLIILRRRWQGLNDQALVTTGVKSVIASIAAGAAVLIVNTVAYRLGEGGKVSQVVQVALLSGVGIGTFAAVAFALRMDEMRLVVSAIRGKIKRKPKAA
jgi:putative peptidoglycan lipid II flippase